MVCRLWSIAYMHVCVRIYIYIFIFIFDVYGMEKDLSLNV